MSSINIEDVGWFLGPTVALHCFFDAPAESEAVEPEVCAGVESDSVIGSFQGDERILLMTL